MKPLKQALQEAERSKLVDDVVRLIDGEVGSKGGLSGLALKGGYKVVKKLKGGRMIHIASDKLLDDFTEALEGLHVKFRDEGGQGSFSDYLKRNERSATDALLGITDQKIKSAENPVIIKTYKKLRSQAVQHVKDALPNVGRMIDRYTK